MTDPWCCYILGNIYHQYTPFLLVYIPYMDPMGKIINFNEYIEYILCVLTTKTKEKLNYSHIYIYIYVTSFIYTWIQYWWFTPIFHPRGMQYWRLPPTTDLLPLLTIPQGPRVAYLAFCPWPHPKWPSPVYSGFTFRNTFRNRHLATSYPKKGCRLEVFQSGGFPGQSHQSHPTKKKKKRTNKASSGLNLSQSCRPSRELWVKA